MTICGQGNQDLVVSGKHIIDLVGDQNVIETIDPARLPDVGDQEIMGENKSGMVRLLRAGRVQAHFLAQAKGFLNLQSDLGSAWENQDPETEGQDARVFLPERRGLRPEAAWFILPSSAVLR